MHDGLQLRETLDSQHGVFACRSFAKGEKILDFGGPLLDASNVPDYGSSPEDDRYVQIGAHAYLGPSGGVDDYVNHSCEPNAALVINNGTVALIAIINIRAGDEITFDYSTTMDGEGWTFNCTCGSRLCRRRIGDFRYLQSARQRHYIALGIVPDYNLRHALTIQARR